MVGDSRRDQKAKFTRNLVAIFFNKIPKKPLKEHYIKRGVLDILL